MTHVTQEMEDRLGKFIFMPHDSLDTRETVRPGPIQLTNDAVYNGEWNTVGEREGRGTQIWKDGSKFEGYWRTDRVVGHGRLIHHSGDTYTGEWKNEMAHGRGTYENLKGDRYVGDWHEDK